MFENTSYKENQKLNTHVQSTNNKSIFMLVVPLALSAFVHIWNPVEFPAIYDDEDTYIKRAVRAIDGLSQKDPDYPYDHPYFGQLFLAGVFKLIDYPDSIVNAHSSSGNSMQRSIEMLYFVPRVLMGILAVIDTFLIYKISERRYNRKVAFIASVLFAVMPITWYTRRILLDSIQLPFLLTSVLFAYYSIKDSSITSTYKDKKTPVILLSGIFLGLAIFTKIPAFTMIPLVGFLIYTNKNNRSLKTLGQWLLPVILIPLIWPLYAASSGEFNQWIAGINHQSQRQTADPTLTLSYAINSFFKVDPVLLIIGTTGVIFSIAVKRDFILLLWVVPYLIFLYFIGFVVPFYVITLLPPFCIAAAVLITNLSNVIAKRNVIKIILKYETGGFSRVRINDRIKDVCFRLLLPKLPFIIVFIIGAFGLISTVILITTNLNTHYFELYAFIVQYLVGNNNNDDDVMHNYQKNITVVGDHRYFWIPKYVFHKFYDYKTEPVESKRFLLIADEASERWLSTNMLQSGFPVSGFKRNTDVYNLVKKYPYTSLIENYFYHYGPPIISEIRTNVLQLNSSAYIIETSNGTLARVNDRLDTIIIHANQSWSLPSHWNDFLRNCDHIFTCNINSTDWYSNKTSFQVSTNTTNKNRWSSIYGNEINVKPGEQYVFITHMKLNEFARQSHIAIEGYNETSKTWNQIIQCPSGINGPLEWKEYGCEITIPKLITKIRPILNAGWSSQSGKQAVTLFDAIYLNEVNIKKHNSLVLNPDFVQHFDKFPRIVGLCQFHGDFDVQVSYRLLKTQPQNGHELNLIPSCSRID